MTTTKQWEYSQRNYKHSENLNQQQQSWNDYEINTHNGNNVGSTSNQHTQSTEPTSTRTQQQNLTTTNARHQTPQKHDIRNQPPDTRTNNDNNSKTNENYNNQINTSIHPPANKQTMLQQILPQYDMMLKKKNESWGASINNLLPTTFHIYF
jgi:hypothetical protein